MTYINLHHHSPNNKFVLWAEGLVKLDFLTICATSHWKSILPCPQQTPLPPSGPVRCPPELLQEPGLLFVHPACFLRGATNLFLARSQLLYFTTSRCLFSQSSQELPRAEVITLYPKILKTDQRVKHLLRSCWTPVWTDSVSASLLPGARLRNFSISSPQLVRTGRASSWQKDKALKL